jgi:hypothetical protein
MRVHARTHTKARAHINKHSVSKYGNLIVVAEYKVHTNNCVLPQ